MANAQWPLTPKVRRSHLYSLNASFLSGLPVKAVEKSASWLRIQLNLTPKTWAHAKRFLWLLNHLLEHKRRITRVWLHAYLVMGESNWSPWSPIRAAISRDKSRSCKHAGTPSCRQLLKLLSESRNWCRRLHCGNGWPCRRSCLRGCSLCGHPRLITPKFMRFGQDFNSTLARFCPENDIFGISHLYLGQKTNSTAHMLISGPHLGVFRVDPGWVDKLSASFSL